MADSDDVQDDIEHHYFEARRVYLQGEYEDALRLNERLRDIARAQGAAVIELIGHRFVGLCYYRLDQLALSAESFRRALALAVELGHKSQELLITNHLCSTLRRQGIYDEAVDRFEAAIEEADVHRFLHERCRLLGNYGALLDELGQRAQADDCYARFEELAQILGKSDRLANARGLAARAAALRGDLEIARKKYKDEVRLAQEAGNVSRELAASIHVARLLPPKDAIVTLAEILTRKTIESSASRRIDAHLALADAHTENGQLSLAWDHCRAALDECGLKRAGDDSHWEKRALTHERLANTTRRAGLHGEALNYLQRVVGERHERYERFRRNGRVRDMAQARLDSLRELADELVDEALAVTCETEKRDAVTILVHRVRGSSVPESWDDLVEEWSRRRDRAPRDVGRLRTRVDGESERRWRDLLGDAYEKLQEGTRANLRSADLAYSAETDDLAWSAHRLALAVEHELRHRLHPRKYKKRLGLGEYLIEIADLFVHPNPVRRSKYPPLCQYLLPLKDKLKPLLILKQEINDLEGNKIILSDLRNAVAHGRERQEFPHLSRLTVDAIKRRLVLEPTEGGGPPVLRTLATLSLP